MRGIMLVVLLLCFSVGDLFAQCGPDGCQIPRGPDTSGWRSAAPPSTRQQPPANQSPGDQSVPDAVRQCRDSIVKIKNGSWGGSGTYIGDGLVISCEHVCRGAQSIDVTFPTGETMQATVLGQDHDADLAVAQLTAPPPAGALGVPVVTEEARPGERIYMAGYGSNRSLVCVPGTIRDVSGMTMAYDPTNRQTRMRRTTEATGNTEAGDSGGAWLTEGGKLRGVHWGGAAGSASATTDYATFLKGICDRNRKPFPPPVTPPFNAGPILDRLGQVEVKIDVMGRTLVEVTRTTNSLADLAERMDGRLVKLETPPPEPEQPAKNNMLQWLAIAAGVLGAVALFYQTGGGGS